MGSLTGHKVSVLLHHKSTKAPVFSTSGEKYCVPVQNLAIHFIFSARDIHKNYKSHLTQLLENWHNPVPVHGQCPDTSRIMHLGQDRWEEDNLHITEAAFHTESQQMPVQIHSSSSLTSVLHSPPGRWQFLYPQTKDTQ